MAPSRVASEYRGGASVCLVSVSAWRVVTRVLHPDGWKGFDRLCGIVGRLPCSPGRVNLLPASRQHDRTTGGKALALDLGTERSAFEFGVRVKSGEEAAGDEVVQALLVRGECRRVHALRCGDDGVVVGDFRVVNMARCKAYASSGQDRVNKGKIRADAGGLDMAPQFPVDAAGEMARRGARVGDKGLFVEGLSQGECVRCREGVARVGGLLQGGQIVGNGGRSCLACFSTLTTVPRRPCTFAVMASAAALVVNRLPCALPQRPLYEPALAWNVATTS